MPLPTAGSPHVLAITGRLLGGLFLILGITESLRASGRLVDGEIDFLVFTVTPETAYAHLAIGIVGVAATGSPRWTRRWLRALAPLLIAWGALGLAVDAGPLLMGDAATGVLHLLAGLAALHGGMVPAAAVEEPPAEAPVAEAPAEDPPAASPAGGPAAGPPPSPAGPPSGSPPRARVEDAGAGTG